MRSISDSSMNGVRVLLFSVLREKLGQRALHVDVEGSLPAGDLLDRLVAMHPDIEPYLGSIRIAVNQTYVDKDHPVYRGDEVALITPVSGG